MDTHALLWAFNRPNAIAARAREAVEDVTNTVLVSAVSAYELAYKHRLGKLDEAELLLNAFAERLATQQFQALELSIEHALVAGRLVWPHKDPFDRLLVAQAIADDLTLVSNEALLDATGVRRLW